MAHIEHHPENGHSPFVVIVPLHDGGRMWLAYRTREQAEQRLPVIEREWARSDGLIEVDDPRDVSYRPPA